MELSAVLYEYSEPEAMTYMTSPAGSIFVILLYDGYSRHVPIASA